MTILWDTETYFTILVDSTILSIRGRSASSMFWIHSLNVLGRMIKRSLLTGVWVERLLFQSISSFIEFFHEIENRFPGNILHIFVFNFITLSWWFFLIFTIFLSFRFFVFFIDPTLFVCWGLQVFLAKLLEEHLKRLVREILRITHVNALIVIVDELIHRVASLGALVDDGIFIELVLLWKVSQELLLQWFIQLFKLENLRVSVDVLTVLFLVELIAWGHVF